MGGRGGLVMLDLFVGIQVMFGHALVMYREWINNSCVVYVGLWYVAFGWFYVGYMFGCILLFWLTGFHPV